MPETVTVWMVPLAHGVAPVDVEGTLELADYAVVFTDARDQAVTRIPLGAIAKVKRHRVSPILMLTCLDGAIPRRLAFYFAPPPPLDPIVRPPLTVRDANFPRGGKPSRRRQRRKNTLYLSTAGDEFKPQLREWVSVLRTETAKRRTEGGPGTV
jgi:hypothetical protein